MDELVIRNASLPDRHRLANLIHFEEFVHRHLDWKSALDWIGHPPYVVAEKDGEIMAVLACPADPPGVAWVRLFAVGGGMPLDSMWRILWDGVYEQLTQLGGIQVFALTLQDWFTTLLKHQSFEKIQDVAILVWEAENSQQDSIHPRVHIRPMQVADLSMVYELDRLSFALEWQNSLEALGMALEQAAIASVAEVSGEVVGYQISTVSSIGGHLARLAVHPLSQGQGIGTALVRGVLKTFQSRGVYQVSVNTQADNQPSLAIYRKTGFKMTGETYPVFKLASLA